jgi:hypothetical protein
VAPGTRTQGSFEASFKDRLSAGENSQFIQISMCLLLSEWRKPVESAMMLVVDAEVYTLQEENLADTNSFLTLIYVRDCQA